MQETRMDDAPVVAQLVAGDRSAFEHIYRKHNASLIRVATGIVQRHASAEEVSQDTWIFFPWDTGLSFQPPIRDGAA